MGSVSDSSTTMPGPLCNQWIVLLNYNLASSCERHLPLLDALPDAGILIVDNASSSKDIEYLVKVVAAENGAIVDADEHGGVSSAARKAMLAGSRLIVIKNRRNSGFAAGNNIALRTASEILDERGQYLIVNPDVELPAETVRELFKSPADIAGPAIWEEYLQGLRPFENNCDFATGFIYQENTSYPASVGARLCGCCIKLSGLGIERYGFLPEENFLYDEETKFFERIHRLGGRPVYLEHIKVLHAGSAAEGKSGFNYFYYNVRNRMLYFFDVARPHYRQNTVRFVRLYTKWIFTVLKYQIKSRNMEGISGVFMGIWHGLLRRSGQYQC